MRGSRWGVAGVIALFSPLAWRSAFRAAREAVIIARNMGIVAAVAVGAAVYWWGQQSDFVQVASVSGLVGLLGLWLYSKATTPVPKRYRRVAVPKQVLYRWFEPHDLPLGLRCRCGKRRVPGELVYVGITGAHRSREKDDDRQVACWWTVEPSVVGTQQLYRTRGEVKQAEIYAIETEHPRENKQHAVRR